MTVSRHRRFRLHQTLILIGLLYFTFIGGTFITEQRLGPRIFHHIAMTVSLGGWLIWLLLQQKPLPSAPVDLPYALFFAAAVLATIFATDPRVSVEHLWTIGIHIILFYLILFLLRRYGSRLLLETLFFCASVVCLIGLIEWVSWYTGVPLLPIFEQGWLPIYSISRPIPVAIHRLTVPLNVATWLAAYLAMLIPVAAAWGAASRRKTTRQVVVLWLVAAVFVLYFTYSRGGFLSLIASATVLGLLVALKDEASIKRVVSFFSDWRVLLGGILIVGLLVFVFIQLFDRVGAASGDSVRFDLWRAGWLIGLSNPILGVGPYGFGDALRPLRDDLITRDHLTTPHNILLYRWSELGAVGLLAFLSLVLTVAFASVRRWRRAEGPEKLRVAGVLAGLVGFAIQNQFDNFTATPMVIPLFILMAYLLAPFERQPSAWMRWVPAILLMFVVIGAVGWSISDRAQIFYARSLDPQRTLDEQLSAIDKAIETDPNLLIYQVQRAQLMALAYDEGQSNDVDGILAAYAYVIANDVDHDIVLANYAALLASDGQFEKALASVETAIDRNPRNSRYLFVKADILEQTGHEDAAIEQYLTALEENPGLAVSRYWRTSRVKALARAEFFDRYPAAAERLIAAPAMVSSCLTEEFDAQSGDVYCALHHAALTEGVSEDDLAAVEALIRRSPTLPQYYELQGELALVLDDASLATKSAQTMLFLNSNRGHYLLGQIDAQSGETDAALDHYLSAGPLVFQLTGWGIAVYNRSITLQYLSFLDVPIFTGYDVLPWVKALEIYYEQGRQDDANVLQDFAQDIDPFIEFK